MLLNLQMWSKSLKLAKLLYAVHHSVKNKVVDGGGILVGGLKTFIPDDNDLQEIASDCDVLLQHVDENAIACRSIWKPTHGYSGLLYRVKEHIVLIKPRGGEVIAMIDSVFTICAKRVYKQYLKVRLFEHTGFTTQGMELVQRTDEFLVAPLSNISRKVMLYPFDEPDDEDEQQYVVMDFMRRVFPVTPATLVVPYYPVLNDMVSIMGEADEVWKARVLSFSLRHQVVQGQFFIERQDGLWIPENTRPQQIHFKSIVAFGQGLWVNEYDCWEEC